MAKNKLKHSIRNLCLAIQICCLLIGSGLDMAVFCHADNGRAEIEAANADGCATLPGHEHEEHPSESRDAEFSADSDCGDCVDVPLSIGRAAAKKESCDDETIATSIELAAPSNCIADATAHELLPQLLLPPPYIGPLSSIVLLI